MRRMLLIALCIFALPAPAQAARIQLGLASQPGGAAAMRTAAPFGYRYQYLAGGVNTGSGWATWNENGTFVSRYVGESRAAGVMPVFPYCKRLQSQPAAGGDEKAKGRTTLPNGATMAASRRDLSLYLRRAKGHEPV